jgi:hypothetical protein
MTTEANARGYVVWLLGGGHAHMPFAEAVADFPEGMINHRPQNVTYTFWHLIEHLRLTQLDILNYMTKAGYAEPEWPRDYWPASDAIATKAQWDKSIADFTRDLEQLITIASDESVDLLTTVPSHDEHTFLREVLIVADHNAYHIGELAILRQVEGAWGPGHE